MGRLFGLLIALAGLVSGQGRETFDVFSFEVPAGWKVERTAESAVVKKDTGIFFCNSYLIRPRASSGNHATDFASDWRAHAAKHGVVQPEKVTSETRNGWEITTGAGLANTRGQRFHILISTRTGQGIAYSIVHYFNDPSLKPGMTTFSDSITVNTPAKTPGPPAPADAAMRMTKFTTNFDDGWVATPLPSYVQVTKGATEVRLYYVNDALEKGRPNNVDPADYFWSQIVGRAFRTGAAQKYAGVNYPPIYFVEGTAQDAKTGQSRYVAMKVIYAGGARVVVVSAPNQAAYRQQFGQPNDLDRMLTYNKFAVTAKDLPGTWVRNAGGGVEYYNAYTGNYAGMAANSTSDEFEFREDGTYRSTHRYANTANGATKFDGSDFRGRYRVTDWEVIASNRVGGRDKTFKARLEAIQNGYLLILTDSDYEALQYILFRRK